MTNHVEGPPAKPVLEPVVLVVNSSTSVFEVLAETLREAGFGSLTAHSTDVRTGRADLATLIAKHQPCAVIWDVTLPYYKNWECLERLRRAGVFGAVPVVVTSPNRASLERIVGVDTGAIQLDGEAADLNQVLAEVKSISART